MKTRYSFLTYIIIMNITSSLLTFTIGSILMFLVDSLVTDMFSIFIALSAWIFPSVGGLISGFISSLLVSLIASMFFSPENISERKFEILSFAIVASVSLITLGIGRVIFVDSDTISLQEVILATITVLVIMSAHYFSRQYLVTPIEKRKSKNSQ